MAVEWFVMHFKLKDGADRISNLPPLVTERILECLPLQDAIKTSFLSRYWRYQWAQIPQLILDCDFFRGILRLGSIYSSTVNNVLLRHSGPIRKFVLYIPNSFPVSADISEWIHFVSVNGVKELSLYDYRSLGKKLPSCLFSCVGLTHLTLVGCYFNFLPPTFSNFPCLTSLTLHIPKNERIMEPDILEALILCCPQLETLDLLVHYWHKSITIHAPKLRDLVVGGVVSSFHLKECANINTLYLKADWTLKKEQLSMFFSCLSNLETLILGEAFWQLQEHCGYPIKVVHKVPNKLEQLTTLKLVGIPVNCHWAISLALSLFGSSPNLQLVEIEASTNRCEFCGDTLRIKQDCSLHRLKRVALGCISNSIIDLQLIKLLLGSSPVLEVMTIKLRKKMGAQDRSNVACELLLYRRKLQIMQLLFASETSHVEHNTPWIRLDQKII